MIRTLTRQDLIRDLRNLGFTYRQANLLLSATLDAMVRTIAQGNTIELPFGTIRVVPAKPTREWKLGKVVRRFKNGKRIVFTPKGF